MSRSVNEARAICGAVGADEAEAQEKLKPAAKKFPRQHVVFYNLACYACQLGELKEALRLLEKAIDLAGKRDIRLMAMEDPDLEPLWKDIAEI